MKKFLLLVCAVPCLLSAQNAAVKNVLKDRPSIQQVLKNLSVTTPEQILTRAGTESIRPDSIYMYTDEAKTDLAGKTIFTYTSKDGKITVEEIEYDFYGSEWEKENKTVYIFNESDLNNPVEIYSYYFSGDDWVLEMKAKAVEFEAAGRPTVYNLESEYEDEIFTMRMEASYNTQGLKNIYTLLNPTGDSDMPWFPVQTQEFFYDADLHLIKEVTSFDDGTVTYLYENDAQGFPISEHCTEGYDGGMYTWEKYYTNFYPTGNSNEAIFSIQSVVYPNPASEVLYVTIEGAGEALVTLVNLAGSAVFQQTTNQPAVSIPLQTFAKGTYILTIQAGAGTISHKVIIR